MNVELIMCINVTFSFVITIFEMRPKTMEFDKNFKYMSVVPQKKTIFFNFSA